MGRFIGSIDVGTVNLALVVYDTVAHCVTHAELINLSQSLRRGAPTLKFGDRTAEFLVRRAVEERATVFAACETVCIEKQLTRKMIMVQYLLEAVLSPMVDMVVQVPAMNVKRHFNTSRGNRAANKKCATATFRRLLGPAGRAMLDARFKKQQHDIADAALQAIYVASRHEAIAARWRKTRGGE